MLQLKISRFICLPDTCLPVSAAASLQSNVRLTLSCVMIARYERETLQPLSDVTDTMAEPSIEDRIKLLTSVIEQSPPGEVK